MSLRISRSVSKNAVNFYIIADVVSSSGKKTTRTVKRLGSLSKLMEVHNTDEDGVMAIINQELEKAKSEFEDENAPVRLELHQDRRLGLNVRTLFDGGYLFLQDVYYALKLDRTCSRISAGYKFEYNLNDIVSDLVFTRIIDPSSKRSSFDAARDFIEPPTYELHDIYRALSVLSEHSDMIQKDLYKNSSKMIDRNTGILYYDCTNYFFEIEQEDGFRKYGKSKENRPNPIVQMGLFMDGDGYPLAFTMFPGNQNEQPSLKPLEKKIIRDFKLSRFIVSTDAGLASAANRRFNSMKNRAFITTQSIKKLKSEIKEWCLSPEGWSRFNDDTGSTYDILEISEHDNDPKNNVTFYKQCPYTDSEGTEQTLIVTYSPRYREYQRSIRHNQIERAVRMIEKGKIKNKKNANDVRRFISEISYTNEGEIAANTELVLNQEVIDEESRYDGFYAVCTNLEDDVERVIKANHGRWEIEESFRIMKSEFKARGVYLSVEERIKAHFLICFIALLIYRIIEKEYLKEKYTVRNIVSTLRAMKFHYYPGSGYVPVYTRTELTDDLHESFKFHTDYEIITEKKMKKIIRQTKS
ncbi:MAG: IS1634 family transposase [bacterium]